jgi:hypothetical protein
LIDEIKSIATGGLSVWLSLAGLATIGFAILTNHVFYDLNRVPLSQGDSHTNWEGDLLI